MIWSKFKTYIIVAVGAVGSVLLIAVRVLAGRNKKLSMENKVVKKEKEHAIKVMEQDIRIDEQIDTHLAEAAKEVEEGKHPSELTDPNKEW